MENTITLKVHGIFEGEYTKNELETIINDLDFFTEAFLILLNPEVAEKSDIPFNRNEVISHARSYFSKENNWNRNFINEVFKTK